MNKNTGIIIINLGSPDSFKVSDVRKYLNEFLMDEKVIDMPFILRKILVQGLIVPFRSPKSAKAYQSVWTNDGSPLIKITQDFANAVKANLNIPVSIAMRYGNPNPEAALKHLQSQSEHLDEILIAPMYPHYAMSSYETALDYVVNYIQSVRKNIKLRILKPFYNEPSYINSLADTIQPYLLQDNYDGILFSYHGLPVRHLQKSDTTQNHCYINGNCCEVKSDAWDTCYKHQVLKTAKLVTEKLSLDKEKVHVAFQSRLGNDKWLQPFTDKALEEFPAKGIKKLLVLCPAFVADCLETLEEMDDRGKESFMHSGGQTYVRVPCLNTSPKWIETFSAYCSENDGTYKNLWR